MFKKEQYMPLVEQGYLSRNEHPDNNDIVILNYTNETTFERNWNDITLSCRGLIINERTGEIIARPFNKFFNYGEETCLDKFLPNISEKPEITVKHDGSLGISYKIDGKVRWSTRGSFVSEQANIAQEIWDRKYSSIYIPNNITLLVEIIHPQTRVVVDYKGREELILIGAINRVTGLDYSYEDLEMLGLILGMPVTERVEGSLDDIIEVAKNLDANHEGFVLRWNDGFRLKVKGDQYVEVHRILHGLSLKQKVLSWANGNLDEYIKSLPEEFRPEIEKVITVCDLVFGHYINYLYDAISWKKDMNRKDFAIWVKNNIITSMTGFMFMLYDGKEGQVKTELKQHIAKNYRELIEKYVS